jgi:hypothetical protein
MAWWLMAASAAKSLLDQQQKNKEEDKKNATDDPAIKKFDTGAYQTPYHDNMTKTPITAPVTQEQPAVVNPMTQTDDRMRQANLMDAIRMGQPQAPQPQQAQPPMSVEDILRQGRGY